MTLDLARVKSSLSDGLLSFPVTDFDAQGNFDAASFKQRIQWFLTHGVSSIFVAGGTGEFFSLDLEEYKKIVQIAVETVNGEVPVIASAGRSVLEAKKFCEIAKDAGADGILLMPPYLTEAAADGVVNYAKEIIQSCDINFIYYNRANGVLAGKEVKDLADSCPNLISLKDGVGQLAALNDIIKTLGDRLIYIGGVPTAEILSEAYLAIGVNTYSSAVFNFVPKMAMNFYKALRSENKEIVTDIIKEFFVPFCRLRDQKAGYGVSLIKSGAKLIDKNAGKVRYPLSMPNSSEEQELARLIKVAEKFS